MTIETVHGYKIPELEDKDFWDSYNFNIARYDAHDHTGVDSALVPPQATLDAAVGTGIGHPAGFDGEMRYKVVSNEVQLFIYSPDESDWKKTSIFDDISPMTTGGDIIYGGASGAGTRLPNGSAAQVLTSAGGTSPPTWEVPAEGDVVGPASSIDNSLARFDSTTGKLIKNGAITEDDSGNLAGVGTLNTHTIQGGTGILALTSDITGTNSGTNTGDQTFDDTNPMTTGGDVIYGGVSGTGSRLANGLAGQVLTSAGTTDAPTWETPGAGAGDVVGPAGSTDNALVRFDSTTGKLLQDGTVTQDDSGNLAAVGTLNTHTIQGGTGTLALTSDITGTNSGTNTGDEVAASPTVAGVSELATIAEVDTGTDTVRTITPAGLAGSQLQQTSDSQQSTGLLKGGVITVNGGDPALFDISAGFIQVADAYTDPLAPTSQVVPFGPFVAQTVTALATAAQTEISINASGNIVQRTVAPTDSLLREEANIGSLLHASGVAIDGVIDTAVGVAVSPGNTLAGLSLALGPIVPTGNIFSANGANLLLNKSAGTIWIVGANIKVDPQSPDLPVQAGLTGATWFYTWQDGGGNWEVAFPVTDIVPGKYDDGTGGTGTPDGVVTGNKWTTQRIYMSTTNQVLVYYGQTIYNSEAEAQAQLTTATALDNPAFLGAIFRGWLIVKGNATALNDGATAQFFSAGKFGSNPSAGSTSTTTLQQGYENSPVPQTVLNSTNGGLEIEDAASPVGGDLFKISANAGGTKYFGVTATGVAVVGTLSATGVVSGSNLSGTNTGDEVAASPTVAGVSELATIAEIDTGTDAVRTITPAGLAGSQLRADVDANTAAIGNPNVREIAEITFDFATTDVNIGTDEVTEVGHGMLTGDKFQGTSTGTLPLGLSLGVDYWAIYVTDDIIKPASSLANAVAGTPVDIQDVGTGTHTFTSENEWAILDDDGFETFIITTLNVNHKLVTPLLANNIGRDLLVGKDDTGTGLIVLDGAASTLGGLSTIDINGNQGYLRIKGISSKWLITDQFCPWIAFAPSSYGSGFGTPTSVSFQWRQVDEEIKVVGEFTPSASAGFLALVELPNSYAIDYIAAAGTQKVGEALSNAVGPGIQWPVLATDGQTSVKFSRVSFSVNKDQTVPLNVNAMFTTDRITMNFSVPVAEFKRS